MHDLGFSPRLNKKGLYFDGHEREDVVEYRKMYLRKIDILHSTHLPPPICSSGQTEEILGSETVEKRFIMMSQVFMPMKGSHGNGQKRIN